MSCPEFWYGIQALTSGAEALPKILGSVAKIEQVPGHA
jgi:hypothetical protein